VLLWTGELLRMIDMARTYPSFLNGMVMFGVAGSVGQYAVYYCLVHFGSLLTTLITTTRKFFSILISIAYFGHELTRVQWVAVAVVFAGLALDSLVSNPNFVRRVLNRHKAA
jgi:solute carrier family 35 (UDP-galactose transporter), member B1